MSSPVTTVIGLVAVIFAGTGMRDPVTMTSCSGASGAAVVAGACCAVAGVDIAAAHAHISDLTRIGFCNLIFISLEVSCMQRRVCKCEDSPLCCCDIHDSRPPTDENENGMNAARSVMKAAG